MTGSQLSLIPWLGGKQRLVDRLLPLIPVHVAYVELFGGGGALLLNKPKSTIEVYNDLDGELVNLFEVVRDKPAEFVKRADFLVYSRELYVRWQTDISNNKDPEDPVERALRFWYVIRSAFGAHPSKGWAFARDDPRNSAEVVWNSLQEIQAVHERIRTVEIDHLDFQTCIKNRDAETTFFFVDPPYLGTQGYRMGNFSTGQHFQLGRMLKAAKGKWLLTIGEHPIIREIYKDFRIDVLTTKQCTEKVISGTRQDLDHLIIRNYAIHEDKITTTRLHDFFSPEAGVKV